MGLTGSFLVVTTEWRRGTLGGVMRLRADGYADMRGLVTTFFVFTDGLDLFL